MITLDPKCFDEWYQERFASSDNMSSCYGHMPELASFLLEEYREKCQNSKLLGIEFGCGDGRFACEFLNSRRFSHFTATDMYDFALERTRERAGALAENLSTIKHIHGEKSDNEKVWSDFFDNNKEKFDLVITANMFHYLTDEKISVVLNEANSLLKNGGILYVCFESDIRLCADEIEFKMPGQTECDAAQIVKSAEDCGFECARKQISLLGEKIFSLPKSARAFLGVEATHYARNICLHEYIFIKNTTEGYRSESIFPYDDYALHVSDSSRKMKDVQEQILNLARNTVSNLKGKTPFEICNGLRDGWNDILRLYSKDERPFCAVHLKYHNLDVDETTMVESKLDGEDSKDTRSGAREYIFPAVNWSALLFKENARYSSASFCVLEDADSGADADDDSFFIGNHISLSKNKDCPKCFREILEKCGEIKLGGDEEDCSRDADCKAIIKMLNGVLNSSKDNAEVQKCIKRWKEIAKKSMRYNLESAISEIINNDADFWGYKNVHGKFVSMEKPSCFSDAELWIIVFFFKMFLSAPNQFIAMAVDGLGSGGGAAQTGAFLTGKMPSEFKDKKDELIYKGLFIKSCDYALAVIRRYQLELVNRKKLIYALNSAVGSIMSRNGSHNIGSHVLAALSHNVGTMPDDQMLYQYIQHRMDYIATATTDRPTWTQPTMFVGDMMRRFLSQRHLLNYISRSEGLKAWEFQSDKAAMEACGGHIKFHIRKVGKSGKVVPHGNYIDYGNPGNHITLAGDVSLAIPGGIVGQHAFFTIIENIVRNAAKHDWVTPPSTTQDLKFGNRAVAEPDGNLDIYIDFEDNPNDDDVHFTVWSRLSDVFEKVEKTEDNVREATVGELDKWMCLDDISMLPLHHHQHVELVKPFIDASGGLRRENWGLAEMKISAGYLQKAETEDIGGIGKGGYSIIVPCGVLDERANDKGKLLKGVYHLGYKFDVPKAKLILLVVDKKPDVLKKELEVDLKRSGIYVREADDLDGKKELSYQYIVMDNYVGDKLNWSLPFRIIVTKGRDLSVEDKVPFLCEHDNERITCREFLEGIIKQAIIEGSGEGAINYDSEKICDSIVESVCSCWVRHLIAERRKQTTKAEIEFIEYTEENGERKETHKKETMDNSIGDKPLSLVVSTEGGNSGAGETLVTDLDIVEYAFGEGIDGALDGFSKTNPNSPARIFVEKLKGLKKNKIASRKKNKIASSEVENKLVFDRKRVLDFISSNVGQQAYDIEAIIKRQLRIWLGSCDGSSDVTAAIDYLDGKSKKLDEIKSRIDKFKKERDGYDVGTNEWSEKADEITDLEIELEDAEKSLTNPIAEIVTYLEAYCQQVKSLISKYSEKIATLPLGFSVNNKTEDGQQSKVVEHSFHKGWNVADIVPFDDDMLDQGETESMPTVNTHVLSYWRHQAEKTKSERYLEGLSGTQSYLSTLGNIEGDKNAIKFPKVARLVENALLRILIVDERTREFLEKHETLKNIYSNMGIYVANDKKTSEELDSIEKGVKIEDSSFLMTNGFVNLSANVINNVRKGYRDANNIDVARKTAREKARERFREQFDIIIIHQGIIDKWLPGASHDEKKVEQFIESLRCVFRYVIITTGRGTPANIPSSARVLPFSTIQTTLFRQYPEKMILTDAIMNMLPVKGT